MFSSYRGDVVVGQVQGLQFVVSASVEAADGVVAQVQMRQVVQFA